MAPGSKSDNLRAALELARNQGLADLKQQSKELHSPTRSVANVFNERTRFDEILQLGELALQELG